MENVILGTVQFGLDYGINNPQGQISEEEVFKILDYAYESGVNKLDTAAAYGNSEERIGKYLSKFPQNKFKIITKFDLKGNVSPLNSLIRSLKMLKQTQVDTIMFHSIEDFKKTNQKDLKEIFDEKGKKYKKLGISVYTNQQIEEVCKESFFEVVQLPFNVLDNYSLRGKHLELLRQNGIEIHTRSVFLQGLLTMDEAIIPENLYPLLPLIRRINEVAELYQIDKMTLMLQYALSNPSVRGVLIGVDSVDQLRQNLTLINTKTPNDINELINQIRVQDISLLNPATWKR